MPRDTSDPGPTDSPPTRSSGGERVVIDAAGLQWSVTFLPNEREEGGGALMFACMSQGRQSRRAIAIQLPPGQEVRDVGDETLRAWLEAAPRTGTLY